MPRPARAGSPCATTSDSTSRSKPAPASVTARAVIGGLRQEWTRPFDGGVLDLHIDSLKPEGATGFVSTSDIFHLAATIDGERVDLGQVDGRFLSSETTESFTGRVIGLYAGHGDVSFQRWIAEGDDE